jgi:hypothetical protein
MRGSTLSKQEWIRRQMEKTLGEEQYAINTLLRQSLAENSYTPHTPQDAAAIRQGLQ